MFLTCLAMTGGEKVTSYEIIIPAFTRFTMTKKEKIIHQAEHTIYSSLWTFFLSLGASPPLVYARNTLVFVNTSSSPCHCEEPSFFVIARSVATKQSHPILPTVFFTVYVIRYILIMRATEYGVAIHC